MIIERRAYRWLASPIRSIVHGRQIPESLVPKECEHPRPSQLSKKNKTIASEETGASASFRKEGISEMSRIRSCHRYFLIRGAPALCAGVEAKRDCLNSPTSQTLMDGQRRPQFLMLAVY
jgi:hypothetical protein